MRKPQPPKIPSADALRLWNEGKSLREIAAAFPGTSKMAAARAIERAVKAGLRKTREYGSYQVQA